MRAKGYEVYVRQADPSNYLNVLEDLKMKEIFNIIIDIDPKRMVNLLNVVSLGMIRRIIENDNNFLSSSRTNADSSATNERI